MTTQLEASIKMLKFHKAMETMDLLAMMDALEFDRALAENMPLPEILEILGVRLHDVAKAAGLKHLEEETS